MTQPVHKCEPSCSTYRVEIERPRNRAEWTHAELLAEVLHLERLQEKSEERENAALRRERIARKRLELVPRWVRRIFGGRS